MSDKIKSSSLIHKRNTISEIIYNLIWIIATTTFNYYTQIIQYTLTQFNSFSFWITLSMSCVFIAIFFYMTIILPASGRKVNSDEWFKVFPRVIQCATLAGSIGCLGCCVMLYGKYSILSPIVVFINVMGAISLLNMF